MLELIQKWLNFDQELQQENDVTIKSVLSLDTHPALQAEQENLLVTLQEGPWKLMTM